MTTDKEAYWLKVTEAALDLVDQHKYTWSMMWGRLPKANQYFMERGDRILINLRSNLESEMFRTGGPEDINVFYPGETRPPRVYQYTLHRGRHPALTEQEWREIGEELEKCLTYSRTLSELLSGRVRALVLDEVSTYHGAVLRAKMALEPIAQKQIGYWSVLYPREVRS